MRGVQGIVILAVVSIGCAASGASARQFRVGPTNAILVSNSQLPESEKGPQDPGPKTASDSTPIGESPTVPVVLYQDGELTITAENSLLTDVLAELRKCMGAEIQLSGSASGQRVWAKLGPGPARKVVSDLLSSTEFNYVIQGSTTDPEGIRSVMLTPHLKPSANEGLGSAGTQTARNRRAAVDETETKEPEIAANAVAPGSPTAPEVQTQPPDATPSALRSPASPLRPSAGTGSSSGGTAGGNTAEQMAQQLQTMYQQRRQIQVNENTQNQKSPSP